MKQSRMMHKTSTPFSNQSQEFLGSLASITGRFPEPLFRDVLILFHAPPGSEHQTQIKLSNAITLICSHTIPFDSLGIITPHTPTMLATIAKIALGYGATLLSSLTVPFYSLYITLLHVFTKTIATP